MQGKITRVSVTWTEHTSGGKRFRFYGVLPDNRQIIRPERMQEFLDDLTLICEQLQAARDSKPSGTASAGTDRRLRRIK